MTILHDLILCYEKSLDKKLPLILIVGREPNSDVSFNNKVGYYELTKRNGSYYWKRTHKYIGEICNIKNFRKKCINNKISPLIYTDISPKPMKYHRKGKKKERSKIEDKHFERHINKIFFKKSLIRRIRLIILGVGNRKEFSRAVDYFKKMAKQIPIIETPFLINYNKPKIVKCLSKNKEKILEVVSEVF